MQFATKKICREMSAPTERSWARLKHLVRYLMLREKAVYRYGWLYEEPSLEQFSDSDWAGCRRTRKSATGGVSMRGPHCLKTWSATQRPIALSSAEAEYYAMMDNTLKAMGIKSMAEEIGIFGMTGPVVLHADPSSAKSFASRRGPWQSQAHPDEMPVAAATRCGPTGLGQESSRNDPDEVFVP